MQQQSNHAILTNEALMLSNKANPFNARSSYHIKGPQTSASIRQEQIVVSNQRNQATVTQLPATSTLNVLTSHDHFRSGVQGDGQY